MSAPRSLVLTDADFGRAYLRDGWARGFLVDLFLHFTVLFVGYRHEDPILKYLARALPAETTKPRFTMTGEGNNSQHWQYLASHQYPIQNYKLTNTEYSTKAFENWLTISGLVSLTGRLKLRNWHKRDLFLITRKLIFSRMHCQKRRMFGSSRMQQHPPNGFLGLKETSFWIASLEMEI